ncbi:hypothetical protein QTO34_008210 [Cnephaeus nilssonii]|uniref:Uncharacterized protein n=1 Tax=Cnephaeus nilssonii TaxID=3371016 RepID=A0AA40IA98_CNENI|nr:hypothetical protein QTO34_008210 [Eptesicus nilssonii]
MDHRPWQASWVSTRRGLPRYRITDPAAAHPEATQAGGESCLKCSIGDSAPAEQAEQQAWVGKQGFCHEPLGPVPGLQPQKVPCLRLLLLLHLEGLIQWSY